MFSRLCFFLFVSFSAQKVIAATPALPLGAVYTYSYCKGDHNNPCHATDNKTLEIKIARIEVTAIKATPSYVFEVSNDGRNYEVKIDQDLWDKRVKSMVAYASDQKKCEDGTLSNGSFDSANTSGKTFDGQDVEGCSLGSDSEYQSAGTFLYKLPSPMPLRVVGGGFWPTGAGKGFYDYETVRKYYRDRYFVATEYLEILGADFSPGSRFDISFTLQKVSY